MLQSFRAKNFRRFSSVSVRDLKAFNLLAGLNGSGKTSFLEALFLLTGANNASLLLALCGWRGDVAFNPEVDYPIRSFFRDLDVNNAIELSGTDRNTGTKKKSRTLKILPILGTASDSTGSATRKLVRGAKFSYRSNRIKGDGSVEWTQIAAAPQSEFSQLISGPPGTDLVTLPAATQSARSFHLVPSGEQIKDHIPAHFISPRYQNPAEQLGRQLNSAVKEKRLEEIIALMTGIEPRIKDIVPLGEFGRTLVYVDIGLTQLVPLSVLGSGFVNYLRICLNCLATPGGILLIDEIEGGIHHSLMKPLLTFLLKQSIERETQIFASTHSDEIIKAFYEVARELNTKDVCALKFQQKEKTTSVRNYRYNDLMLASEIHLEIRG